MERHWRTHLSSELDFFPVHNEKLRFAISQRQIASDQMRSCVHQGTGYSLGSWMTAKVWKSRCQSPSAPSPCDWHPLSWSLKTSSPCWSSTLLVMGHLLQPLSRTEGFQMSQKATRSLESEMDLKTRLSGAINLVCPHSTSVSVPLKPTGHTGIAYKTDCQENPLGFCLSWYPPLAKQNCDVATWELGTICPAVVSSTQEAEARGSFESSSVKWGFPRKQ